ncbi:uncharacterized protein EV420DRAFT_1487621 [Desarmillaria tabescens]|uniref:Uncharacterized protein n=1 Tax=Armillaria tabescens TaxID=1929756 RepID=A0AA39MJN7_ARMTA|nr:uncharacterized protein EV420DRAFT_1487621 [Desarmillaria tabescens]KAK0436174.1 hypothetical protein EV420DRAFT_1487621 [Desarmillaria tabescens]
MRNISPNWLLVFNSSVAHIASFLSCRLKPSQEARTGWSSVLTDMFSVIARSAGFGVSLHAGIRKITRMNALRACHIPLTKLQDLPWSVQLAMASEEVLTISYAILLEELCQNLHGTQLFTATYFDPRQLQAVSDSEIKSALVTAHRYLDAHMETLRAHQLQDSRYRIGLRYQIVHLIARLPATHRQDEWCTWELSCHDSQWNMLVFDETLCIPRDPNYSSNGTHSVVEYDLWPYHVEAVVTPPVCPSMTPSPDKAVNVATTSSNTGVVPQPQRITKPEPPKGPSFTKFGPPKKAGLIKKMVSSPVEMPKSLTLMGFSYSPILNTPQKAQASIFRNLALRKPVVMAKKPVIQVPSIMVYEDEELEEEDAIEEEQVEDQLDKEQSESEDGLSPPPVKRARMRLLDTLPPPLTQPLTPPSSPSPSQPQKRGCGRPPGSKNKKGQGTSSVPKSTCGHLKASVVTGSLHAQTAPEASSHEASSLSTLSELPDEEHILAPRGEAMQGRISMPGLEKDTVHARRFPIEETAPAASGSGMQEGDNSVVVDDVVYACAFHPSVDLQFHEPMSRQALEHLKLSALPPAPASLSKPSTEMRNGRPAVFRAHSDLGAHILHVPNISLFSLSSRFSIPALTAASLVFLNSASSLGKLEKKPAPNARLAGMGNVLHDSMLWISVHYFLSAIFLDAEIGTFYNLAHSHMAERNKVVQELVDGLDSIALREGGTAIIDTYAEVSDLIRSFIVEVGKDASDSGSEGGADNA